MVETAPVPADEVSPDSDGDFPAVCRSSRLDPDGGSAGGGSAIRVAITRRNSVPKGGNGGPTDIAGCAIPGYPPSPPSSSPSSPCVASTRSRRWCGTTSTSRATRRFTFTPPVTAAAML